MKHKYFSRSLFFHLIVITGFISCKKFVDVEVPKTLLFSENTFNSNSTATAALTSIYSEMENDNYVYNFPLYGGISSDELITYSTLPDLVEYYKNGLQPTNGINQDLWSKTYKYIYQANAVIDGLQRTNAINAQVSKQLMGEAKFIRAFSLFNLVNLYGDIPVIQTTDYKVNASASRSPRSEVYQQIVTDLNDAQNTVSINYVGVDDSTVTAERVRPNKSVVSALLARVYLYQGDWVNAEKQATNVIANTNMYDTVSLNYVFLKNSKETIWQLQPVVPGFNTPEGKNFILTAPPATNVVNCTTISSQVLNAFETGDLRKINWIDSITSGSTVYYFPYKYKIQNNSTLFEYSTVFRLAEQYLIRSEARAQQGNILGAQADLNVIRKRAGLPNTAADTQPALLGAILHERQVELFTEWGHRWFDLKRTGKIDSVMSAYALIKGATWNSNKQLYPIPQIERNNDQNLSQNNGY